MTSDPLLVRSKKQLADLARKQGVTGWHSMRKDELVKALGKIRARQNKQTAARVPAKPAVNGNHATNGKHSTNGIHGKPAVPAAKVAARPQRAAARATTTNGAVPAK